MSASPELPLGNGRKSLLRDGTLWAAILASFGVVLDQSSVNIALARLAEVFSVPIATVQLVSSAQLLFLALTIPLSAPLQNRFGNRGVYAAALAAIAASNLMASQADNFLMLILARVGAGIGAGFLLPTTLSMVVNRFQGQDFGLAVGYWVTGATVALLVGPVVGGLLVDGPGWWAVFVVAVPLNGLAMLFGWLKLPKATRGAKLDFDWLGYLCLGAAIACFLLGLDSRFLLGWSREVEVVLLGVSAVALGLFVWRVWVSEVSLYPSRLFRNLDFVGGLGLTVLRAMLLYGGVFALPLILQGPLGLSAHDAGIFLLPAALVVVGSTSVIGRLADVYGPLYLLLMGFVILATAHVLMLFAVVQTSLWAVVTLTMLRALGVCLLVPTGVKVAFRSLDKDLENSASSAMNLVQRVAGGTGVAVVGKLVGIDFGWTGGYDLTLWFLVFLSVPGVAIVFWLLGLNKVTGGERCSEPA